VVADCFFVSINVATGVSLVNIKLLPASTSNFFATVSYKLDAYKSASILVESETAKYGHLMEKSFTIYVKRLSKRSEESFFSFKR